MSKLIHHNERLLYIDTLRGLAVLLMMEQNIGIWLWQPDGPISFSRHPFLFSMNGVGGLAGPLFITLAGIGAALFEKRHADIDRTLFLRGLIIMMFGYLMNMLTPGFLSMGSWFTLHMIGFAILATPVFRRLKSQYLILAIMVVVVGTGVLHYALDTPSVLSGYHMRNLTLPGGAFRLMFVEGHYPVFPWLAFFLSGIVIGRLFLNNDMKQIIRLSVISLSISLVFLIFYFMKCRFALHGPTALFFRLNLGSFPTPPLFVLLFLPVVAFLFIIFKSVVGRRSPEHRPLLTSLGRISLTLQIIHVVIFYEVSQRVGFFRTFSTIETLTILTIVLVFSTYIAILWRKYNFKFSCEWILRKVAG